ncbi:exopolyphosphatase [Bifidobacterium gallicum DSM 20093 = LMG 11596]|uniref:Exopolyphosphatase n=2 Tax=Bifidobacterium gallicum TaxID=78342 RepID=A0A087AEL4_9BIFI|nr:exopolyphosphatase [Bifidobacterium gallicum DSM 20093 = LMG 11596]
MSMGCDQPMDGNVQQDAAECATTSGHAVTVAGIDCGTNSIRLKIARIDEQGMTDVVPRVLRVVRLGQGVDQTHRFADEALERTYAACREFAQILSEHHVDALRFVATSATRDAQNREEFERTVESILGVRPEVIPGTEEARLSFLAATGTLTNPDAQPPYIVIDLGGGSTELVLGGDGVSAPATEVVAAYSMNVGSVRMTERHLVSDPPTASQIDDAMDDVDRHIDEACAVVPIGKAHTIIGVSGTVTTMTALAMGLQTYDHTKVDGVRVDFESAFATDDTFLHMTRAQRATFKTIHPGRIDVVGGGAVVLTRVLDRIGQAAYDDHGQQLDSFIASEHGLLDGIVLDLGHRLLANGL